MKCEMNFAQSTSPDDIARALQSLMSLAASHLFPHYQQFNECATSNFSGAE
jgi:hypothetical protein